MKKFKPSAAQKAQVEEWVEKWRPVMFLNEYRIHFKWSEVASPEETTSASVLADATYKEVTLTVFPRLFSNSLGVQENVIVHELTHVLCEPVKDLAYKALVKEWHLPWHVYKEADERSVTQLANALYTLDWKLREEIDSLKKQVKNGKRSR